MDARPSPTTTDGIAIRSSRVESLDVLRGLTIAFMILVNDPGDWNKVWWPLLHAEWNGVTAADFVFPSFLFIMGCAIPFSLGKRITKGEPGPRIVVDILKRSLILLALGIGLAVFAKGTFHNVRVFGVLQHFAACYFLCGLLFLFVRETTGLWAAFAGILLLYWIAVVFVPIPGLGLPGVAFPVMDQHNNLVAWIDRGATDWLRAHLGIGALYVHDRDPEGILTTLPSCATVIAGMISGLIFQREGRKNPNTALIRNATSGVVLLVLGLLWSLVFPLNKNMWTSSFVMVCAGFDMIVLAALYYAIDLKSLHRNSIPGRGFVRFTVIFGSNPIVAFMLSEALAVILWEKLTLPDGTSPGGWLYTHLFAWRQSNEVTSLLYAIFYVALCFIPSYILWKNRIIIKA